MVIAVTIVEKRNLLRKREIHCGLLGVEVFASVDVVLIELSFDWFLSVFSEQQIFECGCTPRLHS